VPSPFFSPTPDQERALLADLCNPTLSLADIADSHKVPLETLSLYLATPQVQARIDLLHNSCAQRNQLAAAHQLHTALSGATTILKSFESAAAADPALRLRANRQALSAAYLVIQISRPAPRHRREEPSRQTHTRESGPRPPSLMPRMDADPLFKTVQQQVLDELLGELNAPPSTPTNSAAPHPSPAIQAAPAPSTPAPTPTFARPTPALPTIKPPHANPERHHGARQAPHLTALAGIAPGP
jgi:hypothetical protein